MFVCANKKKFKKNTFFEGLPSFNQGFLQENYEKNRKLLCVITCNTFFCTDDGIIFPKSLLFLKNNVVLSLMLFYALSCSDDIQDQS